MDGECAPCANPRPARPPGDPSNCGRCGGRRAPARKRAQDAHVTSVLADFPLLRASALVGADAHEDAANRSVGYVWQGIACPGNIVLVAGAPGDGKSTLLTLLFAARRATSPVHILGRQVAPAADDQWMVLLQEEHGETSTARKLREARQMLGLPPHDKVITLARKDAVIGSALWKEVGALVGRGLVDSIWIDSLARFSRGGDSNSEDDQVEVFAALHEVIESGQHEQRPTLWAVAHTKKGAQGQSTEDVSGSTQRAAQADTVILVRAERVDGRVASARATFIKIREDDGEWPEPCDFEIVREGKTKRVTWTVAAPTKPLADRIVELLRTGSKTKNELRSALGRNGAAVHDALGDLMRDRVVYSTRKKSRGRAFEAYAVRGGGFGNLADGSASEVPR